MVPFGSIPNLKSKWSKSMPLFRQRRLKTIFFGTMRSCLAYMRVPPGLPNPLPPTTTFFPSPLPPSLWIVRLNKFNVKILSAWIAVFNTRLRTEKRQISKYAIKKLKMKYKLGADASKAMMFAMTCVMAAAREHISYTSTIVIFPLHLPL